MPQFHYQGVDRAGKKVTGKLDAPNEGDVRMALRGQGVRPIRIVKAGVLNKDLGQLLKGSSVGLNLGQLVSITRQLQVLISSGIPVVQGLEILSEQSSDRNAKVILSAVKEKVAGGMFLWEALSLHPKAFPKIYVALVRAGEASGSLDQLLKRLSSYLEDADRLRKILKSAMIYPVLVITVAIGVIALMMIFVIPRFASLLEGSGQQLPGPTLFVLNLSKFMVNNSLYIVAGTGISIYLGRTYVKSPEGKAQLDRVLFRVPVFGNLMQKAGIARFSRTMQTLLSSGVNLIDAVDICRATIANAVLEEAVGKIRSEIEMGATLGTTVLKMSVFPKLAGQMIAVGESTGNLDKMLERVAEFYEEEVETLVGGLTKLIEPIMLVVLGGLVGGLLVAMYLPIFKLAGGSE